MSTTTPPDTTITHIPVPLARTTDPGIPPLQAGDRLTQQEFLRRYHAMPHINHAELIEGVVYMPSLVGAKQHGEPHFRLITLLGIYEAATPKIIGGDNSTLMLDIDNIPQPDCYLRIDEEAGGQSRIEDDYIEGAPEFIAEVAACSVSYDLHHKLQAYRRNGVREYVVWRVEEEAIDWFQLVEGRFEPLPPGKDGVGRSVTLPGLWLNAPALLAGDAAGAMQTMQEGLASQPHQKFVEQLKSSKSSQ